MVIQYEIKCTRSKDPDHLTSLVKLPNIQELINYYAEEREPYLQPELNAATHF